VCKHFNDLGLPLGGRPYFHAVRDTWFDDCADDLELCRNVQVRFFEDVLPRVKCSQTLFAAAWACLSHEQSSVMIA
jgi:hypothetical protein